jgi:hypothetical protein
MVILYHALLTIIEIRKEGRGKHAIANNILVILKKDILIFICQIYLILPEKYTYWRIYIISNDDNRFPK